jgi:hypothetical protein
MLGVQILAKKAMALASIHTHQEASNVSLTGIGQSIPLILT